jgi:hypothetical protein
MNETIERVSMHQKKEEEEGKKKRSRSRTKKKRINGKRRDIVDGMCVKYLQVDI